MLPVLKNCALSPVHPDRATRQCPDRAIRVCRIPSRSPVFQAYESSASRSVRAPAVMESPMNSTSPDGVFAATVRAPESRTRPWKTVSPERYDRRRVCVPGDSGCGVRFTVPRTPAWKTSGPPSMLA